MKKEKLTIFFRGTVLLTFVSPVGYGIPLSLYIYVLSENCLLSRPILVHIDLVCRYWKILYKHIIIFDLALS